MRAFVFTDKALARHAGRFVWLALDTEKPANAAFLEKFPIDSWPTLLVIDPATSRVALRWLGGATVPELEHLLDDGEHSVHGGGTGLDERLSEADRLYGSGLAAESAARLQSLLHDAPSQWPRRPRAAQSLLLALTDARQYQVCVQTAHQELPRIPRSPGSANVISLALSCALSAPPEAPWRKDAIAEFEAKAHDAMGPPNIEMAVDDRSSLYESLAQARDDAHDATGRRKVAIAWAAYLEGEAEKATTPEGRAVFDSHRVEAYLMLGEPVRAVPMLQQSEKDLPTDYNPSARLSVVLTALGRFDEALAASDRALAKVYGPRKLRVLTERAQTLVAQGQPAAARKTLLQAQRLAQTFSTAQVSLVVRQQIDARLARLAGTPSGVPH